MEITSEVFDSLVLVYKKAGNLEQALNTINLMREKKMEICQETYCDVIQLCLEFDRSNQALLFLTEMQLSGHEVILLSKTLLS